MPIPDGEQHIPRGDDMISAFDLVKAKYPNIPITVEGILSLPEKRIKTIIEDIVTTGVAFLANRGHDQFIQEVGEDMWYALNQQRVLSVFTTDVTPAAIDLMCAFYPTIPRREISARILSTPFKKGEPYVLFGAKGGRVSAEVGYILIPPEFILKALQDPVEVLASIVFIGSQVRDFANNRLQTRADTSQQVLSRAEYYEAHFLAEAAARNPSVVFSPNAILLRKKFPQGLLAPQIPNWVIYTSAQGNNPQNAGQN